QVDASVAAVGLTVDTRREEQSGARLIGSAVAESNSPQSGLGERGTGRVLHSADELPAGRIVTIDLAVAEVSHEQRIGQRTEVRRRQRKAPGCVQGSACGNQALHEHAVGVEYINESETGSDSIHAVVGTLLLCVRDVQLRGQTARLSWNGLDSKG